MPRFSACGKASLVLALAAASCVAVAPSSSPTGPTAVPARPERPAPASSAALELPAAVSAPTLLITDPEVLEQLERAGLTLNALFGAAAREPSAASLARAPRFEPLVVALEQELALAASQDALAGVNVARYPHRLFDARFLRSEAAQFRLAGVVNRLDRAAFAADFCGETRLIYRLGYRQDAERASKLPLTLGIEITTPRDRDGCVSAARRWLEPEPHDARERAAWLTAEAGPLSAGLMRATTATTRVVVNLQLVRWPSTVRPDLGGHAEYLLRSFRPNSASVLEPEPLENTIDPDAFRDPRRRNALIAWIEQNLAAIDAGSALLPREYLAQRSSSVTPRGLARLANRPFSSLLSPADFGQRDFSALRSFKSASGLLRRLDQLSCPGCHQARSIAGFHLLGEDAPGDPAENALALPISPHVLSELPRRRSIAESFAAGATPELSQPFAERGMGAGGYGAHCSLGRDPSYADWSCAPDLVCSDIEAGPDDPIGQCLPRERQVGDACEAGSVRPASDPRRDHMRGVSAQVCPDMVCNRSAVGFPGGMCTASCGARGATCGTIAILDRFNACLARQDSFLSCIRDNVSPAGLRACDAEHGCRDDYVCARGAHGGVCLPPYFVFQLRVDGHSAARR